MNMLTEPMLEVETINYVLRRQVREMKRFKPSIPFHSQRNCEDRTRCAFHRKHK